MKRQPEVRRAEIGERHGPLARRERPAQRALEKPRTARVVCGHDRATARDQRAPSTVEDRLALARRRSGEQKERDRAAEVADERHASRLDGGV